MGAGRAFQGEATVMGNSQRPQLSFSIGYEEKEAALCLFRPFSTHSPQTTQGGMGVPLVSVPSKALPFSLGRPSFPPWVCTWCVVLLV